jgi:hypothetical protein
MTLEEYKKKAEEIEDWAPGWDAIENCFEVLYPGQKPKTTAQISTKERYWAGISF